MNKSNLIYATNNFQKYQLWQRRIFLVSFFMVVLLFSLKNNVKFSLIGWTIIFTVLLVVSVKQVEELKIYKEYIIIENKSIVPFFSSQETAQIATIVAIEKTSDQVTNEKGYFLLSRINKNVLRINLNDGRSLKIKGNLHPKGVDYLKNLIECLKR